MGIKKCKLCMNTFPYENFGKRSASKDGLKFRCKECDKRIRRNTYLENKERISIENRRGHKKRKERFYSHFREYLNSEYFKCTKCNYTNNIFAPFDWHHIEPKNKKYEISRMVRHTKVKLFEELDKCILLCSNCHRLVHYEEN